MKLTISFSAGLVVSLLRDGVSHGAHRIEGGLPEGASLVGAEFDSPTGVLTLEFAIEADGPDEVLEPIAYVEPIVYFKSP